MRKLEQLILSFVLMFALAIKAGSAIDCYNCDSSQNAECADIKKTSSIKPVNCKPSVIGDGVGDWLKELTRIDFFEAGEVSVPMVCQKIIAKDEQDKEVVFRGCQLDGGKTDVCNTIEAKAKKAGIAITDCATCKEDGCNKSSKSMTTLWLLIVPLILLKSFV